MDGGDAVGAVRTNDGEMSHPHAPKWLLLDQAYARSAPARRRKPATHVVQEPAVHLVDDLEMARHEDLQPFHRPALERLRKQSMVGVGQRALGEVERFVPG